MRKTKPTVLAGDAADLMIDEVGSRARPYACPFCRVALRRHDKAGAGATGTAPGALRELGARGLHVARSDLPPPPPLLRALEIRENN
ncbi:hypothetical protein NL676_033461 [Syzygium grande]|nr:hypothetical protein NL676_033461 [Syzygium grande]